MMCPEKYLELMHDYLDGEISLENEQQLRQHLQQCSNCKHHFQQLNDTVAFIKSAQHIEEPANLQVSVMKRLPKSNPVSVQKWFRRHPGFMAAAIFFVLMGAAFIGQTSNNEEFAFTKQPNVVVEGETVIVPSGEVVKGDLVVKNGDLVVEGEVDGNVTVINGKYMASTAVVTGQIDEVDQTFEIMWYEMKQFANNIWNSAKGE